MGTLIQENRNGEINFGVYCNEIIETDLNWILGIFLVQTITAIAYIYVEAVGRHNFINY